MTLRVLCAPFYPRNPYQTLLARALEAHGVETKGVEVLQQDDPSFIADVRAFRPDVLHLHWLHPWFLAESEAETARRAERFLGEIQESRRQGAKVVWTAHNLVNHDERFAELDAKVTRAVLRHTDRVIVHGNSARFAVLRFARFLVAPWKIRVIPHGHYIDAYPNTIDAKRARAELGIPADQFVFLFVGRIRAYKGLLRLVKTFAKTFGGDELLLIAGKAADEEDRVRWKVIARRTPHVRLDHGHVPDEKLQVYLNAADVVVLPYREALTSGAALLAMSFGKAVVAPRLRCISELVGTNGAFLFDPDQRRTVKQALKDAVKRRKDLPAMGRANFEAARRFDWDTIAAKTARVYRSVARGST